MERKPSLYIGKQPFFIGFVKVDRRTKEEAIEVTQEPDKSRALERADGFAKAFGYVRKENESTA